MPNLQLSEQQSVILQANTRGRIYLGCIGSGKTFLLSLSSIHDALQNRASLITSFSYRNLRDVVFTSMVDLLNQFELPFTANVSNMSIHIKDTQYPILLRTSDNPDKLRSHNLHSVYLEEARELNREVFDILIGRLRKSEDCQWTIVTTTRGKDWVYNIIEDEGLTSIFDRDVRSVSNENVTIARMTIDESPFLPEAYINELKRQYSTSFARQELYAEIVEDKGAIFSSSWFSFEDYPLPPKGIRFWDIAVGISNEADFSVGTLMSQNQNGKYIVHDVKKVKLAYPELRKYIIDTAISDGTHIALGIEDVLTQRAIIDDISRSPSLVHHYLKRYKPTKDKISRALPFASQCELGNVIINKGSWNRELFDELTKFSSETIGKNGYHDDQVDSLVGAYYLLSQGSSSFSQLG